MKKKKTERERLMEKKKNAILYLLATMPEGIDESTLGLMLSMDKDLTKAVANGLNLEGLITIRNGSWAILPEGYEIVQDGLTYTEWLKKKKESKDLDRRIKQSTLYSNYLNIANLVFALVGFIIGVLSADPIKRIAAWLVSIF